MYYLINRTSGMSVQNRHESMATWYKSRGYEEVSWQEYIDFRKANPEGGRWTIYLNGTHRSAVEQLAKTRGVKPQVFAASIIAHWLQEHGFVEGR